MATINIVCDDVKDGWIYSRFVEAFKRYSKHNIVVNKKGGFIDFHYYLPYYSVPKKVGKPYTGWWSHQEQKEPLRGKFINSARNAVHVFCQAKIYKEQLKQYSSNVSQIMPGVDDIFRIESKKNIKNKQKIIVGYVGRSYTSTNRKNPALLNKLKQLPFIDFISTEGKMPLNKIPDFISNCDLIVSPATIEGGPLAITESLATGTMVMGFSGVGVIDEFNEGVIKVEEKNNEAFIQRLHGFWKNKEYMRYNDAYMVRQMKRQVKDIIWKKFVEHHDEVFRKVVNDK